MVAYTESRKQGQGNSELTILKRDLLRRPIPLQNLGLIRDLGDGFYRSTNAFSDRLLRAITSQDTFTVDMFGRKKTKPEDEISELLVSESQTAFGKAVQQVVSGRDFIDLGCGDPTYSLVPRLVAGAYGAKRYIGIDIESIEDGTFVDHSTTGSILPIAFIQSDMLAFVSQLEPSNGKVFYISGIEPHYLVDPADIKNVSEEEARLDHVTRAYIDSLLGEMQRVSRPGDGVIIGQGTHGFNPDAFGFATTQRVEAHDPSDSPYLVQGLYTRR